jgi:hypothetical protein
MAMHSGLAHSFKSLADRLVDLGYSPIPIRPPGPRKGDGKAPAINAWQTYCRRQPTDDELATWSQRYPAHGVGIACGPVVGIDIDILDDELAHGIEQLARRRFGDSTLLRIGRWPKRLLAYRAAEPFATKHLKGADGAGIDILGTGSQFVAFGVHATTGKPYAWPDESIADVALDDLPVISETQVVAFLEAAAKLIPGAGEYHHGEGKGGDQGIVRDAEGLVVDGRERHLANLVYATTMEAVRAGEEPTADGVGMAAWGRFQETADTARRRDDGKPWAWSDATRKAQALLRKIARGEIDIPLSRSHFDTKPLPVQVARKRLDTLINGWIEQGLAYGEGAPPQLGIKAAAGLGKTAAVVDAFARHDLSEKSIEIYVPTHDLADELIANLRQADPDLLVRPIRGREFKTRQGPMCEKHELAGKIARAGLSVGAHLCRREHDDGPPELCEHYQSCPYIAQFRDQRPAVRVLSHEYLAIPAVALPEPDLVVVDERCWPVAVRHSSLALDRLTAPRTVAQGFEGANDATIAGRLVAEGLQDGKPLLTTLREAGYDADELRELAKAELGAAGGVAISPSMDQAAQTRLIDAYQKGAAFRLRRMWLLLAEEMEIEGREDAMRVELRNVPVDGERQDRVFLHYMRPFARVEEKPALLIDADLDQVLAAKIFPEITVENLPVERKAEVIQVSDTACSKRRLIGTSDPKEQARAANRLADVQAVIDVEAYPNKRVLVVASKAVAERLRAPLDGEVTWFGALRGVDAWKGYDSVVVAGREQPPPNAIDGHLRALFWDRPEPLRFVEPDEHSRTMLKTEDRGYRLRRGHASAEVAVHPDDDGQRLLEQIRECEIAQAIDRLRLVHADSPKRVIVLSNVVCDIEIDRLVAWGELVPSRLAQAFIREGAVPLSAGELSRCFPDLWETSEAARMWLRRANLNGVKPLEVLLLGDRPHLIHGAYRHPGQRGKATPFVVDGRHGDPQAVLESVVGPIAHLEITRTTEPARRAPARPQAPVEGLPQALPPVAMPARPAAMSRAPP